MVEQNLDFSSKKLPALIPNHLDCLHKIYFFNSLRGVEAILYPAGDILVTDIDI